MNKMLLVALFLLAGCATTLPPPDAVPERISITTDTKSLYWQSKIKDYIPREINKHAHYELVTSSAGGPYKMLVHIISTDSYVSGIAKDGGVYYRTRIEMEVKLSDSTSKQVWGWSGWADYPGGDRAIREIADQIREAMMKDGLLVPSYYK